MKEINTEEFNKLVYSIDPVNNTAVNFIGEKPVVIDFFAPWCGPCKVLAPKLEDLQDEYPNVDFYKIDVDNNMELARIFNIRNVPTVLYIDKTNLSRTTGVPTREQLIKNISELK